MAITAGSRLGPYEIAAPLGAGGMGEVWRARDTRLERSVAIKLLPAEFATNTQLRLRFEREAKTISQLNDPHICTLYDVGHEDGRDYLVMEYLDGETLADRIDRGPLPLNDVIRYGSQIAAALERAHAAGIIHRDLKPANVMLTKSGAKLLDFGLAKPQGIDAPPASAMTVQKPLTAEGTIIGTFQYMAPEQLEGEEADERTDIFALGMILYEMVTGRRAFQGKTRTSLIAAIVDREPAPISTYQPLTPRSFERVVMTCLAKEPAARWQSAHDVRLQLQWVGEAEEPVIAPRNRSRLAWWIAAALALTTVCVSSLYFRSFLAARNRPPIRTSIIPPDKEAFEFFIEGAPAAISPDGTKIVFGAGVGTSGRTLWLRTLDSPVPRQLSGTEGASHPFWSPDSRFIAFSADGFLKKVNAAGGAPVNICPTPQPIRAGSWSADGTIVVGQVSAPIMRVPSGGGSLSETTVLDEERRDNTHRWPWFLPDGKHFLFLAGPHPDDSADVICVGSTADKKLRKPVVQATSNAAYYDGWILYVRDQLLMAQRFDPNKLEVSGDPVAVPEQRVEFDSLVSRAMFSIANNGTLVYQTGEGRAQSQLTWLDRSGKSMATAGEAAAYGQIALSPDQQSIVFSVLPRQNLWMYDRRGVKTRLTFGSSRDVGAVWSPDGAKIAFASNRGRYYDIYVKDLRTGAEEPLVLSKQDKFPSDWSADGRYLFYNIGSQGGIMGDVAYFNFEDRKEHMVLASPFNEGGARLSPDGKWIAYWSSESPPRHIFVAPFPPTGAKWQVSSQSATSPRWRRDGQELFFNSMGNVYAVPVKLGASPEIGAAMKLFTFRPGNMQSWEAAADGQRFLVNSQPGDAPPAAPLTIVQHFDSVLRDLRE